MRATARRPRSGPFTGPEPGLLRAAALGVLLAVAGAGCAPEPADPAADPAEAGAEGASEPAPSAEDLLDGRPLPDTAHPEVLMDLREGEAQPVSPADGQGEATVEPDDPVRAGTPGSWTITYTAGPSGIAAGGAVVLQVSPFWGWSDPQTRVPELPGYTTLSTPAPGVLLEPEPCGGGCLRIGVEQQPLPAGGELVIRYGGSGPAAARADDFAEGREEFFLRVDGDGDAVTAPIGEHPELEILPGPPQRLHVVVPTAARAGDPVWVNVAALDARWNRATGFTGGIEVADAGGLEGLPEELRIRPRDRGARRFPARAAGAGISRVTLRVPEWGAEFRSNPLLVAEAEEEPTPRVYWADLHGHSSLSDGTGTPDDYFGYARDVAALDVSSLTDHDHWGLRFLDREPALFEEIRDAAARFHEPGRFVTLLGYEWTSWIFGHRHVLYFGEEGEVFGSVDRETDEPEELWDRLAETGLPALTVPHHPGGGPVAIDWSVEPDPRFEPVVEISSVHGSSECAGCPSSIYDPAPGSFVRDALGRGYRLGLVGSGDTHDGHPGLGSPQDWIPGRTLGLAAVLADELDRASVLEALRARRVYATSGPRILLRFAVAGAPMGESVRVTDPEAPRVVYVRAVGTAPIERVDVVRNGEVAFALRGEGREQVEFVAEDGSTAADGDYLYARVVQEDGGLAWSSPVWIDVEEAP